MQLNTDYTHQNVKKEYTNNHFWKRSRSQIEIDKEQKIDTSRKKTKWGIITIPVYHSTRWWRFWRPNPVIMIKLPRLAEDLLCQIKSMSTDDMIVDLLMILLRIIRAIKWSRRNYKKFVTKGKTLKWIKI